MQTPAHDKRPVHRILCIVLSGLGLIWASGASVRAEEPYQRFLQKLRDERLFDLALVYLEGLESQPGVGPEFKLEAELEKGLLLFQSAALMPPSNAERADRLDRAEAALREFLDTRKNHPRRGEARLKLGELLLNRADEARQRSAKSAGADGEPVESPEAIGFYTDAHELFEATIQELAGILDRIKGARVDSNDQEQIAIRQQVRLDLRQAQLLSAKAVEERGRSYGAANPKRKADLEKSLAMFSELYTKERSMAALRNYALFYRSGIQKTLGMPGDAIDGLQRIADVEGADELRPLQSSAIAQLTELLAAEDKFPVAVDRADKWIGQLRPDEQATVEAVELKLALARVKLAWSDKLKAQDASDRVASRLVRDTRNELRSLLRIGGGHLDETREMLAKLGVGGQEADTGELPEVNNFAEAFSAASERIDGADTASLGLATLREQGKQAEAQEVQQAIEMQYEQARTLLGQALKLYSSEDDRQLLFDTRFRLAFVLMKLERPLEAMAVAEFLSAANPGTDKGLRAAAITLGAFSDLLRTAGEAEKAELTGHLQPFAEYLVATWPQSSEAAAAASALVQLAIVGGRWDDAERLLSLVPAGTEAANRLYRQVGLSYYAEYERARRQAGEDTEETDALKAKAERTIKAGIEGLTAASLDAAAVDTLNAYVRLLLANERVDEAADLLLKQDASPIKFVSKQTDAVPTATAMASYGAAIQVATSQLAVGKIDSQQATAKVGEYVAKLEQLAAANPDGARSLAGIFVRLASNLKSQLAEVTEEAKRTRLSEALVLVAAEAAKKSDSFSTQYWSAETIVSIADEMRADRGSKPFASRAYADAAATLESILERGSKQPGWIEPEGLEIKIRMLLAQANRGLGNHKSALDQLSAILEGNANLLDVQIEAARTYQAWGDASNSGFHKPAFLGGRPIKGTRDNLIWGWGKIARIVEGKDDYAEQFYEARYQLALSRFKYALGLTDADLKSAEIGRAERSITSTASLYPDLGGPAMKKKYNELLRTIQRTAGQ